MYAESFLSQNGYRILERNYHTPFGELDIIAIDGDSIVFIEVKTRTSERYGTALQAITFAKMNHMIKSALFFIGKYRYDGMNYRFDVVTVTANKSNKPDIRVIKNAFQINQEYS